MDWNHALAIARYDLRLTEAEFWDLDDAEFFLLWHRHLVNLHYVAALQTPKPITPHQFMHFGMEEPEELRYKREADRRRAEWKAMNG